MSDPPVVDWGTHTIYHIEITGEALRHLLSSLNCEEGYCNEVRKDGLLTVYLAEEWAPGQVTLVSETFAGD